MFCKCEVWMGYLISKWTNDICKIMHNFFNLSHLKNIKI
jgi:hypothetical protein